MASAGDVQRHPCPACGTVGSFRPGQPRVCKVCGTQVPDPALPAPAPRQSASAPLGAPAPRGEPPTALAIVSLVCGVLAFFTLWVTPLSVLFFLAALACGIVALAQNEGDTGVQVMAGIGIGLAVLALIFTWWAWMMFGLADSGSSVEYSSSGGTTTDSGGSGGGGGGGGSGGGDGSGGGATDSQGGSSGGGDTSGGSGASDSGGGLDAAGTTDDGLGAGGDVEAPMPVAALSGLGLLAAAAWRRRA